MTRRHLRYGVLALAAGLLTACGLPSDSHPRRLAGTPLQQPASPPAASARRPVLATVYLVQDRQIIAVRRPVGSPATLDERIGALLAGPATADARLGLRTALSGGIHIDRWEQRGDAVILSLAPSFTDTGTEEQILALAQLVYTVTELPGTRVVRFTVDGQSVAVPRADGSLTSDDVGRADYATLLRRR